METHLQRFQCNCFRARFECQYLFKARTKTPVSLGLRIIIDLTNPEHSDIHVFMIFLRISLKVHHFVIPKDHLKTFEDPSLNQESMEPNLRTTGVGDEISAKLSSPLVYYKTKHSASCEGSSICSCPELCLALETYKWTRSSLSHIGLGRGHRQLTHGSDMRR